MNDELRTKMLLNACRAPLAAWEKMRGRDSGFLSPDNAGAAKDALGLRQSSALILSKLPRDWPEREMDRLAACGARFVFIDGPGYPVRMKDLPNPPIGLYVRGKADLDALPPMVAIVGTRGCSRYGFTVAETLGRLVVRAGYGVVSGGAKGIDAAGHSGCLAEGGTTVAVFGTGIDRVYPADHKPLFLEIAKRGALVSEYIMGSGGEAWRFPERNRLIVGLGGRVIVVESPEDGGAMITARLALNIGREIWCVPGRITDPQAKGTNSLIRDGANPIVDLSDGPFVLDEFIGKIAVPYESAPMPKPQPKKIPAKPETPPDPPMSGDEQRVLEILKSKGGRTADEIMAESGLGLQSVQAALATLLAYGFVRESGPGRYGAV
ncbi:MAG: DNA-processing protein DprA [Synergistaceae bacterium]|jgi:DNA processing protein|nr:DNA-processing protein DprA [Synergistaceae bacterium]